MLFNQRDLHEEVYMSIPQGFKNHGNNKAWLLLKSLYSLKQASGQWNLKFIVAMLKVGSQQSIHDFILSFKETEERKVLFMIKDNGLLITMMSLSNNPIRQSISDLLECINFIILTALPRKLIASIMLIAGLGL